MKELEDMRNDELFTIVVAGIQILRENERKQGYEDGKADTPFTDTEEAEKKAYNRGLNDAWEAARKIAQTYAHFTCYDLNMIFGDRDSVGRKMIFEEYTPQDAIRKIKEYEDKQKDQVKKTDLERKPPKADCDKCAQKGFCGHPEPIKEVVRENGCYGFIPY